MYLCQNESCSQHPLLYQTGFSDKQGCTHYCKICGWGYWTHLLYPTTQEVDEAKRFYPKLNSPQVRELLVREILKPKPVGAMITTVERTMIEYLGNFQPYWLKPHLKKIWRKKYLKLYPPKEKEKK